MTDKIEVTQRARDAGEREAGAIFLANSDVLCEKGREIISSNLTQAFARFEHETRLAGERAGMERAAGIAEEWQGAAFGSHKVASDIAQAIRAQAGEPT